MADKNGEAPAAVTAVAQVNGADSGPGDEAPPLPDKVALPPVKDDNYMAPGTAEHTIQKKFMTPGLSNLERAVMRNNKELEQLEEKMRGEREEFRKDRLTEHIPDTIKGHGMAISDIMAHLEALIVYENFDPAEEEEKFVLTKMKDLDEAAQTALLAHSVAAYVSTLEPEHVKNLTTRLTADVTLWISALFRCKEMSSYTHTDEREGLVNVGRLLLHHHYPKYQDEGYEALYPRPPVIYVSAAAKPGLGLHLCSRLGLPKTCLRVIPCNTGAGSQEKMDVENFKSQVTEDKSAGRTPLLVVAYAGTPVVCHVDDIEDIQTICKENEIWLHCEGPTLALLTFFEPPSSLGPARSGNSLTFNLSGWTGVPTVPYVTLYNEPEDPSLAALAGLLTSDPLVRLQSLPLWVTLQQLGHRGILERIQSCTDLAKLVRNGIKEMSTIKTVTRLPSESGTRKKKQVDDGPSSFGDIISMALSAIFTFDVNTPVIVFKYAEKQDITLQEKAPYSKVMDKAHEWQAHYTSQFQATAGKSAQAAAAQAQAEAQAQQEAQEQEEQQPVTDDSFYNAANIWLGRRLEMEVPQVKLEMIEVDDEGQCLRFAPLETAHGLATSPEHVQSLLSKITECVGFLDATVSKRRDFLKVLAGHEGLAVVTVPNWPGLGAIQYIPKPLRGVSREAYTEQGWREVDAINMEVVFRLKSQDSAFSQGRTDLGHSCVKFGLVEEITDVDHLVGVVFDIGQEVEESSRYLEQVSEAVKKGIEEANKKLEEDHVNMLKQQGVLRQVPVVGRLVNWWSPGPKEGGTGRAFNIQSGKVETTESTYKFKMQVAEGGDDASQTSSAPSTPRGTTSHQDTDDQQQ